MSRQLYLLIKAIFQPKTGVIMWGAALGVSMFIGGIYLAIFIAPNDYLQGVYAKIMYIHVPSAWLAMLLYGLMAVLSWAYIVWRIPLYSIIAEAICLVGACLTFITLVTGAVWGKPTWGTWWVWDARLTSMLILLFIYLGCMALSNSFNDREKGGIFTSYFAVFGLINIPIIKFSVNLWNTLHQPSTFFRLTGPAIHHSMLPPLIIMLLAMLLISWANISLLVHIEQLERKYRRCVIR